jgi:hypothetical protein
MEKRPKIYQAMIWADGPDKPGQPATVHAVTPAEARHKLEAEFGVGTVFDLHNPVDAARPR